MSEENTLQAAAEESYVLDSEESTQDEAQNPEVETPKDEPAKEQPEGTDPAAKTGESPEEKIAFDEKQQEWLNSREAKHKRRERELEQEREKLAREMEELRQKLPKETRPEIPPIPDRYDDDYADKIRAREEAIAKQAAWDLSERQRSEEALRIQQEKAQQQQQALTNTIQTYSDRAGKLGVSKDELKQAGEMVAAYNLPNEVALFILEDDQGPLITQYLARNLSEAEALRGMTPYQAVAKIAADIKQKAIASKRKPNPPPDPHETLNGVGAREKQIGPPGATFE